MNDDFEDEIQSFIIGMGMTMQKVGEPFTYTYEVLDNFTPENCSTQLICSILVSCHLHQTPEYEGWYKRAEAELSKRNEDVNGILSGLEPKEENSFKVKSARMKAIKDKIDIFDRDWETRIEQIN